MRLSALSSLAILAALTAQASAFDDLIRASGLMPPMVEHPLAFQYVSPHGGFANPTAESFGRVDDQQLAQALAMGEQDELTGLDFGKVNSVLSLGVAPQTTTVIFGEPGFTAGADEALLARDFTATEDGDLTIYSHGDDYSLDLAAASQGDPLGAGMGKAQRLAVGDDVLVRTAGWPEMGTALNFLDEAPLHSLTWLQMIEAMRQVSGEEAELELATGWTVSAFRNPGPMPVPGGKTKTKASALGDSLLFPIAIIGLTRNADTAGLHIAIPYADAASAERDSEIIADRLGDYRLVVPEPTITITPPGESPRPVTVMVLTVSAPVETVADLQVLYTSFMQDIYMRDFKPLALTY